MSTCRAPWRSCRVDGEATLDAAEDDAVDALVGFERLLQQGPRLFALGLLAGQHDFAVAVLVALNEHLDGIAGLDFRSAASGGEFLHRHTAFGLQTNVDHCEIVLDADDGALDHGTFERVADAHGLVQERSEIFHSHVRVLPFIHLYPANRLVPAVLRPSFEKGRRKSKPAPAESGRGH